MTRGEIAFAGGIGAVGVAFLLLSLQLPYLDDFVPAAGYFPLWIAIALVVLVILHLVMGREQPQTEQQDDANARRPRLVLAGLAICVAVMDWTGFGLAVGLYLIYLLRFLERTGWTTAIGSAVAITSMISLVFATLLSVPLPRGPWGF